MPPCRPMTRIASNRAPLVGQAEVEDHERLRCRDPRLNGGRQLGQRVLAATADCEGQSVVDGAVGIRCARATPASPITDDRSAAGVEPVPGLSNDRNVVVPPNAAATES